MTTRYLLPFLAMLMLSSAYGEGELNRFVDFEKNAAELKFIENPDFWAKGVDFSALSVWNDATKDMWGGGCEHRNLAGVAISSRHVLCSHHYGIPTGTTLYFLGTKSGVVGRKVMASDYVAQGADLRVCLLDEDLPRDIVPLKILPENYADYLGDGKGLISATMNQYRELVAQKLLSIPGEENRMQLLSATRPIEAEEAAKYKTVISGDSGCPRFLLINNEPVLISLMWKGGSGSGVFIPHFRREIQETMNRLAKGYELECSSLASLPLYTPPSTEIKSPAPSPAAPNSGDDNSGDEGDEDGVETVEVLPPLTTEERLQGLDIELPILSDYEVDYTNSVVGLVFTGVERTSSNVVNQVRWDTETFITSNKLVVVASDALEREDRRAVLGLIDTSNAVSNTVSFAIDIGDYSYLRFDKAGFFWGGDWVDSDGDGIINIVEKLVTHSDPYNPDSDNDGMPDGWEVSNGLNPNEDDSTLINGNGVSNRDEYEIREYYGLLDSNGDYDGDGIPDLEEIRRGLDPKNNDSDGDGVEDGVEDANGMHPLIDEANLVDVDESMAGGIYYTVTGDFDYSYSHVERTRTASANEGELEPPIIEHNASDPCGVAFSGSSTPMNISAGGKYFTPTVSGEYAFQIYADDDGELNIGHVTARSSYPSAHGEEFRGIFQAGVSYPITASLYNDGGPLSIHTTKFGELKKVYGSSLTNYFNSTVVMFEDSYLGVNGNVVAPKSTRVTHTISANGGAKGGTLTVRVYNLGKLRLSTNSDYPRNMTKYLSPGEPFLITSEYVGNQASDYENDVRVEASFVENDTFTPIIENTALTVAKVEVQATADFPREKHRHAFGPLEKAQINVEPSSIQAQCLLSGDNFRSSAIREITLPNRVSAVSVTVVCNGVSFNSHPLVVIAPTGRSAISCAKALYDDWQRASINGEEVVLEELWSAMKIKLQLEPQTVSFRNLEVQEGYCEATDASESLRDMGPHDRLAGAGRPQRINPHRNGAGIDLVAKGEVDITLANMTGSADWNIPVGWHCHDDPSDLWFPLPNDLQRFSCTADGELTITKFGCYTTRNKQGLHFVGPIGGMLEEYNEDEYQNNN